MEFGENDLKEAVECILTGSTDVEVIVRDLRMASFGEMCTAIEKSPNLLRFSIGGCSLSDARIKELADAVWKSDSLISLSMLGYTEFGMDGVRALALAVANSRTLTRLNICGTNLGPAQVEVLAVAIGNSARMTTFKLYFSVFVKNESMRAFSFAIVNSRTLTKLNFAYTEMGNDGAAALAAALAASTSMTTLNLACNHIGDEGAIAIASAFATSPTLTTLNLNDNKIGPSGAVAIAAALGRMTKLKMRGNDVGDGGAVALAFAVGRSETMKRLDINRNRIGDDGAVALAKALTLSKTMTALRLDLNDIGDVGATALAVAVEKSMALIDLDLSLNRIGNEGAKALIASAAKSRSMTTMRIGRVRDFYMSQEVADEVLVRAVEYRRLLALMGAFVPGRGRSNAPAETFVLGDGDNALGHRSLAFLLRDALGPRVL
jgi:hypothetical protein